MGTAPQRRTRGFTLFETIFVIGLLAIASVAITKLQPSIWRSQNDGRDQYVGLELVKACGERLLAVRRKLGYANVTNTLCNGMGGLGGFAANPTVVLLAADNVTQLTVCSTATCTATITIAKTTAPAASLAALTLQLSSY